ncbi:MAG: GNAT family N-acetyltransferase [Ferruginibacter sp.]|nr:GNAT family N-acetyltransferase [Chitinophagaceae bacterium]MBP6287591.1 GNAT family N-acetyltransferase [Ferruginibacter sp.]
MPAQYKKLDNPAWHALTETHAAFATGTDALKRYYPDIVLFAGYDPGEKDIAQKFDEVFEPGDSFFLFDDLPVLPANYQVETVVQCLQMVCEKVAHIPITENILPLNETNWEEMYSLVSRVFPGYYLPGTPVMGDYFGIFKEGELVSMAGERLRMDGLTEISAVVTHPDHVGRKYAQQLVTYLDHKNLHNGIIPFLHTGSGNERAIKIYELLGYKKRRIIPVTKIKRVLAG